MATKEIVRVFLSAAKARYYLMSSYQRIHFRQRGEACTENQFLAIISRTSHVGRNKTYWHRKYPSNTQRPQLAYRIQKGVLKEIRKLVPLEQMKPACQRSPVFGPRKDRRKAIKPHTNLVPGKAIFCILRHLTGTKRQRYRVGVSPYFATPMIVLCRPMLQV